VKITQSSDLATD